MAKWFVRSWDVFDTLIARRCGAYDAIFDIMSESLGADFRHTRIQAEAKARDSKIDISIDDVYDEIQRIMSWTSQERQLALELEIRTEFSNVIPIAENMALVQDGDILVSDMYLSNDVIMGLLRKAGLDKSVKLFVSTRGKNDGTIWRQVRAQNLVMMHTGDNPVADFLRPLLHGIPARLTNASAETPWERTLRANGAPELSSFVREMRLRTVAKHDKSSKLQVAQIEVNFPLLLLASAYLVTWCADNRVSRALLVSRDCFLWKALAAKVAECAGSGLSVEYFLISRVAALRPSEGYLAYAGSRLTRDSVVVDLSMTGVSLSVLADRLGISEVNAFVINLQRSGAARLYGKNYDTKAKVKFEYLLGELAHKDLEAFNQAPDPSVHDVAESEEGLSITYATENRPASVIEAVKIQNATFFDLVESLPEKVMLEVLSLARGTRLVFLIRECEQYAGDFVTVVTRANPGAALWNDPNGLALNLPYARNNWIMHCLVAFGKTVLGPLFRPGSPLHPYKAIPSLVLSRLIKR